MQSRLHPIIQCILLLIVPILVIFVINYLLVAMGKMGSASLIASTMKISLFVIPNALFIIMHRYKLSKYSFIIAALATFLIVRSSETTQIMNFNTFSLYAMNFIYFSLFIGVTYLAYFKITNFKLKNFLFIIMGTATHTLTLSILFLINKQQLSGGLIKATLLTGVNTYLMVGLALGIALLWFELPQPEILYDYDDEDED